MTLLKNIFLIILAVIAIYLLVTTFLNHGKDNPIFNESFTGIVVDLYEGKHSYEILEIKHNNRTNTQVINWLDDTFRETIRIGDSLYSEPGDTVIKLIRPDTVMRFPKWEYAQNKDKKE